MHHVHTIGIDEVGRGPLAGPVAVGVVAVSRKHMPVFVRMFRDVKDSKQLSEKAREVWFGKLRNAREEGTLDYTVAMVGAPSIDRIGIVRSIRIAMARALTRLACDPRQSRVLLDGSLYAPTAYSDQRTIIRGDESERIIATASIVAKVTRDRKMKRLARQFPDYGFERHKGYGTAEHIEAIRSCGKITGIHRQSFLGKIEIDVNP